jgi:flagellar M-ring protein FliF
LETAEHSPLLLKYAALLAALLAVMMFGVRPALRRVTSGSRTATADTKELPGSAPALNPSDPPPLEEQRTRAQQILEEVSEHLKREPAQTSRLLQSWIHTD